MYNNDIDDNENSLLVMDNESSVNSLISIGNSSKFICASSDGKICTIQMNTNNIKENENSLFYSNNNDKSVNKIAISHDNSYLYSVSRDLSLKVWNLDLDGQ